MHLALQKNANGSFRVIDQLIDEEEYILFPSMTEKGQTFFPQEEDSAGQSASGRTGKCREETE